MNENKYIIDTVHYYDEKAQKYIENTHDLDMSALYAEFLPGVPDGGLILDAGCGSGRDSKAFIECGYRVIAFDYSKEMVKAATSLIGINVDHMSLYDLDYENKFHGIWACASLLHIPRKDMSMVFTKLIRALKMNGVMYVSFKEGHEEEVRNGRLFNCYTTESLQQFITRFPELTIVKHWRNPDVRPDRVNEYWQNMILKKQLPPPPTTSITRNVEPLNPYRCRFRF